MRIDKKHLTFFFVLVAVLVPVLAFATDPDNAKSTVDFVKGKGTFEEWFMYGFKNIDMSVYNLASDISLIGKMIGGIGVMISLGWMGFQMQSGDREWEIMPMIKPFLIGFIIFNWTPFCKLIQEPFEAMSSSGEVIYKKLEKKSDEKRVTLYEKKNKFINILVEQNLDSKYDTGKTLIGGTVSKAWNKITKPLGQWGEKTKYYLQKTASECTEAIGLGILRIATYFIFFIQKVWGYILIVLGPMAFGIALIPGFESTINNWIAKFININLYSFIAYTIINIGHQIIMASFDIEIDRYDTMIKQAKAGHMALVVEYNNAGGLMFSTMFEVVSYIVIAISIMMIPTIADSVVSAGGAMIMTKMKSAGNKTGSGAKTTARATVGGVAGGVKGAVTGAVKGASTGGVLGGVGGALVGGAKGTATGVKNNLKSRK